MPNLRVTTRQLPSPLPGPSRVFLAGAGQTWRHSGGMGLWTALSLLLLGAFCYSAWLTSIVDCATNNCRPLLIASAMFFPVGIVHGIGVWFGL